MSSLNTLHFYSDLPYIDDFLEVKNQRIFKDIPINWHVIITDIKGSTTAIEEGKYKEVNFLAACSTTAILNIDKTVDFPFVFGGDGATILIPEHFVQVAKDVLIDTQKFARQEFGMEFRVGIVPVIDILRNKQKIKVAKLKLSEDYFQSIFIGGGLDYAEYLVKNHAKYSVQYEPPRLKADFSGVKCLWQDLPCKNEEVVSLLVKATNKFNPDIYNDVVDEIFRIYGTRESRFPVQQNSIKFKNNFKKIYFESIAEAYQFRKKKNYVIIKNLAKAVFKTLKNMLKKGLSKVIPILKIEQINSIDSEKFDDMLRMVISGSKEQRERLTSFLEYRYQLGDLAYGINVAKSVYMTCLVYERKARQTYFIDGSNAGYTIAAKELKNRIKWQKIYMH